MAEFRCKIVKGPWGDYRVRLEQLVDGRYGETWVRLDVKTDFWLRWTALVYAWFWVRVVRRRFARTGSWEKETEWYVK